MKSGLLKNLHVSVYLLILTGIVRISAEPNVFYLSCESSNDLYRTLKDNHLECARYDSALEAVDCAPEGSPVLILAKGYPEKYTQISKETLLKATSKKLRLYLEYPQTLVDDIDTLPSRAHWERAVITTDRFGDSLKKMRIVAIQDCHFITYQAENTWISLAKVAGFDTAVFGLPENSQSVLFEFEDYNSLISTTKLSHFVTGRYAPVDAWPVIWDSILEWLTGGKEVANLEFEPSVHASFDKNEKLPADFERQAVIRGVNWYRNARLVVHDDWKGKWKEAFDWFDHVAPAPLADWPLGNGSCGILEGHSSRILVNGDQYVRWFMRADCNCESAMAFALRNLVDGDENSKDIAANLLDYVYFTSNIQQGPRANPESPSYGLLGWDTRQEGAVIYYGDDNARAFLGTMAAAAALKSDRWNQALLKGILGNFRTSGKKGFRGNNHRDSALQSSGWETHFASNRTNFAPHFESWIWATYLWLYDKTGYEPLLERTKTGIGLMMDAYPEQWRWTNGIQQERARMILPLAWLVRVDDTEKHRKWLRYMADELLARQDRCGAIREEIGTGNSAYGPPRSNDDYGRHEATLLQKNGDPVCDLLYTTNFAFFALNEAAGATGDKFYAEAVDKLAEFLCRIQAASETKRQFDGAWFRAFEYDRWDYWASNADIGWGAWSTETGWTQGWISSVLALRYKNTCLWELTADSTIGRHFEKYKNSMIPDEVFKKMQPLEIRHAAVGAKVTLSAKPAAQYAGSGAATVTDGIVSSIEHTSGQWLGYEGQDFQATIDLGQNNNINTIAANFLQNVPIGIFLPNKVEFAVSDNGMDFRIILTLKHQIDTKTAGPLIHKFKAANLNENVRYIRVTATNIGTIPKWHHAKGRKAWLFVGELMVNPESGTAEKINKPEIEKLGTIDIDLVETTPVVFKNKLYRFEYVRKGYWNNKTGDSYFRFIDHKTGKPCQSFAKGYHLGSAFVDNDTVYVTGVKIWNDSAIDMFISKDLINWKKRNIIDQPELGIFNTSLCKANDRYVLMFEIGNPPELAGNRFTALFAESKDLKDWQLLPPECNYSKDRYTAPHCLRYLDGWFYNFYLEVHEGYEMRVVRSKDLIKWESSPLNPVLRASPEDKIIAKSTLSSEQQEYISNAADINNSDIDFCEYKGRLIINYSWGNQQGREFLAEAVYNGSQAEFLPGWFPEKKASNTD